MLKFLWSLDVGIWRFLPPPWRRASPAIAQLAFATFARAMRAAENLPAAGFNAVTDDFAAAMIAFRRDHLDRAFETIKDMGLPLRCYLKGFVVIVSAVFTFSHNFISPPKTKLRAVFILIAAASAASSSSANHQTSTSKFQRNFNQQTPKQKRPDFGIDFGASLDVEAWDLEPVAHVNAATYRNLAEQISKPENASGAIC